MKSYSIIEEHVHPLCIWVGNQLAVVDTGRKESLAEDKFEFLERDVTPARFSRRELQRIRRRIGVEIDMVLGCDALLGQDMRIRRSERRIDFGEGILSRDRDVGFNLLGGAIDLPQNAGMVVFPIDFQHGGGWAWLHTGFGYSHMTHDGGATHLMTRDRKEVYPSCRPFEAYAWMRVVCIHGYRILLGHGVLPPQAKRLVDVAMARPRVDLVLGANFLRYFDVTVSRSQKKLLLDPNSRSVASLYLARAYNAELDVPPESHCPHEGGVR